MHIDHSFLLSEMFNSPQCEGDTTGVPAFFIRVAGCNLSCGISRDNVRAIKREGSEGWDLEKAGDLVREGKATWACDSVLEWLHGKRTSFEDVFKAWEIEGIVEWVRDQRLHLIYTGGEPTVLRNQLTYVEFLKWLKAEHGIEPYTEIETNGTQVLTDEFFEGIQQINCSPKLSNSGMCAKRRIVPEAIKRIQQHKNHWFKFVVACRDDVVEYEREFIIPFNMDPKRICMMPAESNREDFHENTKMILELAKEFGYRGLQRLHISAWNETTGC